jgi:hypothetical protein
VPTSGAAGASYLPTADADPADGWDVGARYRFPDQARRCLLPVAIDPGSEELSGPWRE